VSDVHFKGAICSSNNNKVDTSKLLKYGPGEMQQFCICCLNQQIHRQGYDIQCLFAIALFTNKAIKQAYILGSDGLDS
jgi:hypothetical protein